MDNPFSKADFGVGFQPFHIVPITAMQMDDLINAFGIFIRAGHDIVSRCARCSGAHVCHVFLVVHVQTG